VVTGGVVGQAFQRVNVEHAEQARITGLEMRERIWTYAELYPRSLTTVVIETNNGGALAVRYLLTGWPGVPSDRLGLAGGQARRR